MKKILLFLCIAAALAGVGAKAENIIYPTDAGVLNVKTQYGAVGDGIADDTAAIQRALAEGLNNGRIVYLPNGTYLVSDTLKWNNASIGGTWNGGWGRFLSMQGQSRDGTVIKLRNAATGFGSTATPKPVIMTASGDDQNAYSDVNGEGNQAFQNSIWNLTVDVGSGNPGAIGIDYQVSNWGTMADVTVRSSDATKRGFIGIETRRRDNGPGLIKNVSVDGFQYGATFGGEVTSMTVENITLTSQSVLGIYMSGVQVSIRKLTSINSVRAVQLDGISHGNIVEANLSGGSPGTEAILVNDGNAHLHVLNVTASGYASAINNRGTRINGLSHSEWLSDGELSQFSGGSGSLKLPIEETPGYFDSNLANWISAGAPTGGDDTAAIQSAMNSGKSTIYFRNGVYRISNTIIVPASVKHIMGCGATIYAVGDNLGGKSAFKFMGGAASDTTVLERFQLSINNSYWIEHASPRTVALKNIGGFSGSPYINQAGAGKLFIEDVTGGPWRFNNPQTIWARQLNPEPGSPQVFNNGGTLWILGFKTESALISIETRGGGKTELLGGLAYTFGVDPNLPAFIIDQSIASFSWCGISYVGFFNVIVRETQGTVTRELLKNNVYWRGGGASVPLYVSGNSGPLPIPATPTGVTATPGPARVTLAWNASSGASTYNVKRSATSGGPYTTVGSVFSTSFTDTGLVNGTTYYYVVSAANSSGESANSAQVSAAPRDLVVWFKADAITGLANGAPVATWIDSSGTGNNATQNTAAERPTYVTGAINGLPAVRFTAANSTHMDFNRAVQDDFTIVCVFKSTQGIGTSTAWYNGAGLVDGEVGGVTSDFGMTLNANGQVLAGTGSPDAFLNSGNGFNNGMAHVATFKRTQSTGAIVLYIDGVQVSSATGGTQSLTAPSQLVLGALQVGWNFLDGDIAEVKVFGSALADASRLSEENDLKAKYGIGGSQVPPAPSGLTASAVSSSQINLTWTDNASTETGFKIERKTGAGGTYAEIATVGANVTSYNNTGLAASTQYFYRVRASNASGDSSYSNEANATTQGGAGGSGTISREVWTGIGGNAIANIPLGNAPNISDTLTSLEGPTDWADNYGTRIRGYITAPSSGDYTFWLASDDNGELWLSTNHQLANRVLIASVAEWTSSREWNKYASQKSATKTLVAGQQYYIEVLQKEGLGGDNVAVGWAKPGEATTAPSEVIPGTQLSPYVALPSPWQTVDIGAVGLAGSASESSGTFTVRGSGLGVAGTADQFRYVYQTMSGDGSITARLTSQSGTLTASLAGVMVRETINANSRFAMVAHRGSGNNNMRALRRTSTGGGVSSSSSSSQTPPNCWVRITRTGNSLAMASSTNGTSWTTIATSTVTMASNVTVGLVVTSGNNTILDTDLFNNVTVVP